MAQRWQDIRDFAVALQAAPLRWQGLTVPRGGLILDFLDDTQSAGLRPAATTRSASISRAARRDGIANYRLGMIID